MQHPKRSETQATNEELDREIAAIISDNNDAAHTIQVFSAACMKACVTPVFSTARSYASMLVWAVSVSKEIGC